MIVRMSGLPAAATTSCSEQQLLGVRLRSQGQSEELIQRSHLQQHKTEKREFLRRGNQQDITQRRTQTFYAAGTSNNITEGRAERFYVAGPKIREKSGKEGILWILRQVGMATYPYRQGEACFLLFMLN